MRNELLIGGKAIRAMICDMDGTLVNSLLLWDVYWEALGVRFFHDPLFRPAPEVELAMRTLPTVQSIEFFIRKNGLDARREEVFQTFHSIGMDFYRNKVETKPGVREFLAACRARGITLCIASASREEVVGIALDHCAIRSCFSRIFTCEAGKGKEFPDVFIRAREELGLSPGEAAVVEDSPVALETAARAGFPTVGVYDFFNPDQARVRAASTVYVGQGETLMKLFAL